MGGTRAREEGHRGDTTGRRRAHAALHAFLVLVARLAETGTHVHEPRRETQTAGVDQIVAPPRRCQKITNAGDPAALDAQLAHAIHAGGRIEQARAGDQAARHGSPLRTGRVRASRQAMRTATPIST